MSNILHINGFESTIPFLKIPFHTLWQVTYPFACYTSTKGPNYISWLTFKRGVYIFVLHACQATLFYKGYFSTNVHICIHIIRALFSKKKNHMITSWIVRTSLCWQKLMWGCDGWSLSSTNRSIALLAFIGHTGCPKKMFI